MYGKSRYLVSDVCRFQRHHEDIPMDAGTPFCLTVLLYKAPKQCHSNSAILGNVYQMKAGAAMECRRADRCDGRWDRDRSEAGAATECSIADRGDRRWDRALSNSLVFRFDEHASLDC